VSTSTVGSDDSFSESCKDETDLMSVLNDDDDVTNRESKLLLKEQLEDTSIRAIYEKAKNGDKTFFISSAGLLHRRSYSRNVLREQLVLPRSYRARVIDQAHDKLFGGHFAAKRTKAKIETYFW